MGKRKTTINNKNEETKNYVQTTDDTGNSSTISDNDILDSDSDSSDQNNNDIYKLFIFYPDGIEDTENKNGTAYSIDDGVLTMSCTFKNNGKELGKVEGELTTAYCFEDTELGLLRTWRYMFYNVRITNVVLDSSTDFIRYHIVADGFDVNAK